MWSLPALWRIWESWCDMTKELMWQRNWFITMYWIVVTVLFGGAMYLIAFRTPDEPTMGTIQKIFYLHLPVAINTFLACLVVFVASAGYVWHRESKWDDLAASAAKVAVVLCTVLLLTGMIWGRGAWGRWWAWSPRLTFSLVLWLLYVIYLIVRNAIDSQQRRAVVAAVYGIIAFLDVPLVYLSATLMPEIHPASVELDPAMQLALLAMFVPVTLATVGLVGMRYLVARDQAAKATAGQQSNDASAVSTTSIESLLGQAMTVEGSRD